MVKVLFPYNSITLAVNTSLLKVISSLVLVLSLIICPTSYSSDQVSAKEPIVASQKQLPKNIPAKINDTGNPKFKWSSCAELNGLPQPSIGKLEVTKVLWYFPYITLKSKIKYTVTAQCSDGTQDCWECDASDPNATTDIKFLMTVSSDPSINIFGVRMLSIKTDSIDFQFVSENINKNNCNGLPQNVEMTDETVLTWHCIGRTGKRKIKVTLLGSIQGCGASGRQCFEVKCTEYNAGAERITNTK